MKIKYVSVFMNMKGKPLIYNKTRIFIEKLKKWNVTFLHHLSVVTGFSLLSYLYFLITSSLLHSAKIQITWLMFAGVL